MYVYATGLDGFLPGFENGENGLLLHIANSMHLLETWQFNTSCMALSMQNTLVLWLLEASNLPRVVCAVYNKILPIQHLVLSILFSQTAAIHTSLLYA